ncbi:hypothetical protein [Leifsonia aquatica]|uniref:hypothetical protein n=1 Tax=Leifsonia aquatica TaxID=144185 RepID=UPI0028AD1583|nr:hypothetical protein [Leifsonia aquatica]
MHARGSSDGGDHDAAVHGVAHADAHSDSDSDADGGRPARRAQCVGGLQGRGRPRVRVADSRLDDLPFSDSTTLQTEVDGNTIITVAMLPPEPIEGAGSILMICTMEGTADAPVVVKWSMKDV